MLQNARERCLHLCGGRPKTLVFESCENELCGISSFRHIGHEKNLIGNNGVYLDPKAYLEYKTTHFNFLLVPHLVLENCATRTEQNACLPPLETFRSQPFNWKHVQTFLRSDLCAAYSPRTSVHAYL